MSNNNLDYFQATLSGWVLHEGFYSATDYPVLYELIDAQNNNIITSNNQMLVALTYEYSALLNRSTLVATRQIVEQFLTNKSPKILKDWNGNIWLIMFTDNISLDFTNEWGMGLAKFSAPWVEIGDAEDQISLQETGLIDIGGV